jgi:two-component system phosphate regulon sensor histidine kinase PhoR
MRSKLEALEKLRSQFVSDVSHELRTPLTAIKGLAETLQDGAVDDPAVRDRFLASIEQETDRMIRMTQDLLTLTRIDGKSLVLHPTSIDLLASINKTLVTLSPTIAAKQLVVTVDTDHNQVNLDADPDRLIQILVNLLDNAVQFAPVLSTVLIQVQLGSIEEAAIRSSITVPHPSTDNRPTADTIEDGTHWVVVRIQDQGPGIASNDLAHVFERFYRADTARTRASGGVGLGLSIAAGLVKEHRGHLWLHSPVIASDSGPMLGTLAILMLPIRSPGH